MSKKFKYIPYLIHKIHQDRQSRLLVSEEWFKVTQLIGGRAGSQTHAF
jgi:hypothetical protein